MMPEQAQRPAVEAKKDQARAREKERRLRLVPADRRMNSAWERKQKENPQQDDFPQKGQRIAGDTAQPRA